VKTQKKMAKRLTGQVAPGIIATELSETLTIYPQQGVSKAVMLA
jgi:hypothetical protein